MSDGYYYYSWTGNLLRILLDKSGSLSLKKNVEYDNFYMESDGKTSFCLLSNDFDFGRKRVAS